MKIVLPDSDWQTSGDPPSPWQASLSFSAPAHLVEHMIEAI